MNQKHLFSSFVLVFVFVLAFLGHQQTASASEVKLTEDLETSHTSYDMNWNKWENNSNLPFTLTDGSVTTEGFGLSRYSTSTVRMYAEFYINDYDNTTLDTTISLEKAYSKGDYGESEVVIYADHQKIYTKHFTNKTKQQHVKIPIPKNTETLTFYVLQKSGATGSHDIIFSEPKLTNELGAASVDKSVSIWELTASETSSYDVFFKKWDGEPFENKSGTYIPRAIAFDRYSSSTKRMYATYNISDYNYTTLETKVSLDKAYSKGDLGTSQLEIYADNKRIYTKKFTNKTGIQNVAATIPKGTEYLRFYVLLDSGSNGVHRLLLEEPILTNKNAVEKKKSSKDLWSIEPSAKTNYSLAKGEWNNNAFQMKNGQMIARAYGFDPYSNSYNEVFAKFYIGDYSYKKFKTTFSVDKNYSTGSRGSATVQVYAGSKKIYAKKYTNSTKVQNVSITLPKKTKYLTVKVIYKRGSNYATLPIIMDNPLLAN